MTTTTTTTATTKADATVIDVDADGRITPPVYPHVAGEAWVFDTDWAEDAILLFDGTDPVYGFEYRIYLNDDEDMPRASLICDGYDDTFDTAGIVHDLADATADGFVAWLHDCAACYSWTRALAATGGLATLLEQRLLPERGTGRATDRLRLYESLLMAAARELRGVLDRRNLALEMLFDVHGATWAVRANEHDETVYECDSLTEVRAWLKGVELREQGE